LENWKSFDAYSYILRVAAKVGVEVVDRSSGTSTLECALPGAMIKRCDSPAIAALWTAHANIIKVLLQRVVHPWYDLPRFNYTGKSDT
jgi:hypothetical protein